MKKLIYLTLMVSMIFVFSALPSLASDPDLQIVRSDTSGVTIEYILPGYTLSEKKIGDTVYDEVIIIDYGHIKEKGRPQLPLRGTMIGIPEKGKVTLKVTGSDYQTIHLKKDIISADLPNLPLQVKDEKTYGTNAFYPGSLATEGFTGYMRDQKVMQLLFYPVQYNPVTREVRIYKHISVEVTFDNSLTSLSKSNRKLSKEERADSKTSPANAYEKLLKDTLLNYDSLQR